MLYRHVRGSVHVHIKGKVVERKYPILLNGTTGKAPMYTHDDVHGCSMYTHENETVAFKKK